MKNQSKNDSELESTIKRLLEKYSKGIKYDPEVVTKLSDFSLNYIYYILNESDELAFFKNSNYINGEHIKISIDTFNKKTNLINSKQFKQNVDNIKNLKHHSLNSD